MPRMPNYKIIPATKQNFAVVINLLVSLYIKRGKVSVTLYVGLYNAGRGANDVIMRIAGLVALPEIWRLTTDTGCKYCK